MIANVLLGCAVVVLAGVVVWHVCAPETEEERAARIIRTINERDHV